MPNTKAQKKTMRMDAVRRDRNRAFRTRLHTALVGAEKGISAGEKAAAEASMRGAIVRLDKSVTKGIVHPNKAARKKSRLMRRLAAVAG